MIINNGDGSFSIVTEAIEIVNLVELKEQLAHIEMLNSEINNFNSWLSQQPEEYRKFVPYQYPVPPIELMEKISKLEEVE